MAQALTLLTPDSIALSESVIQSLAQPNLAQKEEEFSALFARLKEALEQVYLGCQQRYRAVILTCSEVGAVEAMLSSLAPTDRKTLVASNGLCGERMLSILRTYQRPHIQVKAQWSEELHLSKIEQHLRTDKDISHVAAVHHESSTGRLNDIDSLNHLCRNYNKQLLIDATASFGAEYIDFELWNLQAAAIAANYCLHAPAGIGAVLVEKNVLDAGNSYALGLYLDLFRYYKALQNGGFSHLTQAGQLAGALLQALSELAQNGGWEQRNRLYLECAICIRNRILGLNLLIYLELYRYGSSITSFALPSGWIYQKLHAKFKERGVIIGAGQGGLYHTVFRVGNFGELSDAQVEDFLTAAQGIVNRA